ncbi:hypothetical protein BT96DRAFT_63314 [Gymnopus androsaceus JB14]|uniref:Uncharacterized protein n=1 Tax=Gymnopus androsaceus JB14 TaxID=1447944 RepID=A0A6A4HJT2_9AGAR|nr:hypothetical protein BT96DRAFT_63314 [Gymnopus androsaceus JB14]
MVISVPVVASSSPFDTANHRMGVGRPYSTSPFAATPIQVHMNTNSASSTIRSAIWRIIIFQLSFTLILVLASISTLIDVIAHHTQPTPFGTQHVALLLAAWGPVIVFGECFARFPISIHFVWLSPFPLWFYLSIFLVFLDIYASNLVSQDLYPLPGEILCFGSDRPWIRIYSILSIAEFGI